MQQEEQNKAAFQTKTPKEGAKHLTFLLSRLTVLRQLLRTEPVERLFELCGAIAEGNRTAAAARYHAMTAALLDQSTRRVTGDIWKDFLFSQILESKNRFSTLAAQRRMDPPVQVAMEQDLRMMQELFTLTGKQLTEWIGFIASKKEQQSELRTVKKYGSEENISRMASSAWGGGYFSREKQKPRPVEPEEKAQLPDELELENWVGWLYDDPGERLEYVADDGLAVIYRRFLAEEDWGRLAAPLVEFHRQYGCGEFLRWRAFVATDEGMQGMELSDCLDWDALDVPSSQKERLYANTIRFLHTGKGENVLLYGPDGMGKSSLIMTLAKELPDLRIIVLAQRDFSASMETLRSLSAQPFRFIALMDDLVLSDREYRRLKAAFKTQLGASFPALLYATANARPADSSLFGLEIGFELLTEDQFRLQVDDVVREEGGIIGPQALAEYVRQWRENGGELSLRSARRLAGQILRSRE